MNVLLLHPGDQIPASSKVSWDLIVDFARAPVSTYEAWGKRNECPVKSLFDFAAGMEDLHRIRELLQPGMGILLDQQGNDWWEIFSPLFVAQLQQLFLIERLAREVGRCDLYETRPDWRGRALQYFLGCDIHTYTAENSWLTFGSNSFIRTLKHYFNAARSLDRLQLQQVLWDKFDENHSIRRRMVGRQSRAGQFVILPSAYQNVSRTAVAYAKLLPEQQFLLVCARRSAQLNTLPPNVDQISLDPYFVVPCKLPELSVQSVATLKEQLASSSEEFRAAISLGNLDHLPSLLRWGAAIRQAWDSLFDTVKATACFSTDDSNPYTRIPLLLAQKRQLPTVACHHGALDYMMAIKAKSADIYLAKSEMEYDYLRRLCRVPKQNMTMLGSPVAARTENISTTDKERWLVFFSEPFNVTHWRPEEVYRELLPKLLQLAQRCGLKMVLKLHPFESVRAMLRLLKRISPEAAKASTIMAGPPTPELWERTSCAIVIQSTVAIDCAERGIPVFMCNWLRDPYSEYTQQFERFGLGHVLDRPEQMDRIPGMLDQAQANPRTAIIAHTADPLALQRWLCGYVPDSAMARG